MISTHGIKYEVSEKSCSLVYGGIGLTRRLAEHVGLIEVSVGSESGRQFVPSSMV